MIFFSKDLKYLQSAQDYTSRDSLYKGLKIINRWDDTKKSEIGKTVSP